MLAGSLIVGLASSAPTSHRARGATSSPLAIRPHRQHRQPPAEQSRPRRSVVPPSRVRRPPARAVALEFSEGWLGCLYHHESYSRIRGILPQFATVIERQLAGAPVTHGDPATDPRVLSLALTYNCRLEAVTTVTYTVAGHVLQLHPNLVVEPDGWKVFAVPELPAQIPLPRPLHDGQRLC